MGKVSIKSPKEIKQIKEGGKILAEALLTVAEMAKEASKKEISASKLNSVAEKIIRRYGAQPSFLGYADGAEEPFPASLCVSINNEIVHGVPDSKKMIKEGDLVKLDLGVKYKRFFTDAALTVAVGKVPLVAQKLLETTRRSLEVGLEQLYPGSTLGNYGSAVEKYVLNKSFFVVKRLVGHGVGYGVHEAPQIPNYGKAGEGLRLKIGMVLALEPMVNETNEEVIVADNGFTFETLDGGLSAHFEHTVVITEHGFEILTDYDKN